MKQCRSLMVPLIRGVLFLWAVTVCHSADWAVWGGPGGNFITTQQVNLEKLTNPRKLWEVNVGRGYSSLAVKEGLVYTMGNDGKQDTVYCLDARTGGTVWTYSYPQDRGGSYAGPQSMPVIDGANLYTLSKFGYLLCLDRKNGRLLWEVDLVKTYGIKLPGYYLACSPVIEGNVLLLNVNSRGIGLDKRSGAKIWVSPSGRSSYASPVVFTYKGKRAAALFGDDYLFVVDVFSGTELFNYPWQTSHDVNAADPVYFDNKLFLTTGYGKGCVLLDISGTSPRVLWQNTTVTGHFSTSLYYKGYLYCTNDDANSSKGDVRCLDPATGKLLWKSPELGVNAVIIAGDKLLILTDRGDIHAVLASPAAYSLITTLKEAGRSYFWTAPVTAEGVLLIRNHRGDVYCFDIT